MQCPRCGLQNQSGVSACARCGLPVGVPSAPGSYGPPPPGASQLGSTSNVRRASGGASRVAATAALVLAALLALGYAVWSFTGRRGIFSDFATGRAVAVTEARSNDRIDTVLLIGTGVVALLAVAWWVARKFAGQTSGRLPDDLGMALMALGTVVIVVGLVVASRVGGAVDQVTSGDRGVAASVVTGIGFLVLGVGLAMGASAVLHRNPETSDPSPGLVAGHAGW